MQIKSSQKGAANIFQTVILLVFGVFVLVGFLALSGVLPIFDKGGDTSGVKGVVTVWGTLPKEYFKKALDDLNKKNKKLYEIRYTERDPDTFDRDLVEALASGEGPDIMLFPENLIVRHADKIFPIPFKSLTQRDFKDTFMDEGELYVGQNGSLALPLALDPLVLYWNRDLFNSAGVSLPPKHWDEFYTLSPLITVKDDQSNVSRSAVALGEYRNISHAKDILSLLIFQAGSPITRLENGKIRAVINERAGFTVPPAETALRFYTEFSNPVKAFYSWNRALPESKDMFIGGDLAVYAGFAGELSELRQKSPHLNFDVAEIPQARDAQTRVTFGKMYGLAVLKQSKNPTTAFRAIFEMTQRDFAKTFSTSSGLPPARRDLLTSRPSDPFLESFYESALISRAWFDPDPDVTEGVFRDMVENVVSGRIKDRDAIERAQGEIQKLFDRIYPR